MAMLAVAAILLGLVAYRVAAARRCPAVAWSDTRPAEYRPVGVRPAVRRRRDGDSALDPAVTDALNALEDDGTP